MAINSYDIVSTLQALGMMKYWKGKHIILKKQASRSVSKMLDCFLWFSANALYTPEPEHFCFIAHAARALNGRLQFTSGRPSPAVKRLAEGNCKLNLFPAAASSCHANAQEDANLDAIL
jgi:hypothetical protein